MSRDAIILIEKSCGRKFSEEEAARLRDVGNALNLRDDDAVWSLLAAMEYQRVYYEALPGKIAGASRKIVDGMAVAAKKESAAAQAKLTDSVVEQAKRLSVKIQYATVLPMGLTALICLLAYGSLMLWAGFRIDTGRDVPLAAFLHMPSGWLISGLCLASGLFCGAVAAKNFGEAKKWWKSGLSAMLLLMLAALFFALIL